MNCCTRPGVPHGGGQLGCLAFADAGATVPSGHHRGWGFRGSAETAHIPLGRRREPADVASWIERFAAPPGRLGYRPGPHCRRWARVDLNETDAPPTGHGLVHADETVLPLSIALLLSIAAATRSGPGVMGVRVRATAGGILRQG